ncbi:cytochrome-c peroxidase [Psychromonas sp. Urea-02u-13]|uniref:cytochrome-c peroxidase n=1 Tax=Psychromonas sp. Urea-02u-13 TaxID=2058326 RepID=UPI000C34330B|nr:cytochrome c peroxidase [Psychromonas sp. Urea-02u-13]PKG37445.1 tryptophan tryptophylquinone biosynthesis enzyme MauG [Psychromonas sp. Urea-02u-13]
MLKKQLLRRVFAITFLLSLFSLSLPAQEYVFEAGHESLKNWQLIVDDYALDSPTKDSEIELGKKLFFDPRLSNGNNLSCATCHDPMLGWSDALPVSVGFRGQTLTRSAPTIVNTAFNKKQMWDGRFDSLEQQVEGPLFTKQEMNASPEAVLQFLQANQGYQSHFKTVYGENQLTLNNTFKAIASFERTVISNTSRFDAWLAGDKNALTYSEVAGFKIFVDTKKGNCEVCHSAPNFNDDGFHNIGVVDKNSTVDVGRYQQIPIKLMKGAFKTPTLRDISYTAPYFHNGSAKTLKDVIKHYVEGGENKDNLSPEMKPLQLTFDEKVHLENFLKSLSSPVHEFALPTLPIK